MAGLKHSFSWFLSIRLAVLDIITLLICGIVSTGLHGYTIFASHITVLDGTLVITASLFCLNIIGGYEMKRDMGTLRYASEHFLAMGAVLGIAFILTYSVSSYNESIKPGRTVLFLTLAMATPLTLAYRYYLSHKAARSAANRFFYVVGTPSLATKLLTICKSAQFRYPLRFINVTDEKCFPAEMQEFALNGARVNHLFQDLLGQKQTQCEGVIIDLSTSTLDPELENLLFAVNLHSVPVYPVESFIETFFYKIDLSHVTVSWALDGTFKADHHKPYGRFKSLIDILLGLALFIVLLPLLLFIALLVKIGDGGPVLFTQIRIGRFGTPFLLYKFRTMSVSREENTQLYTTKRDSRITKVGNILRLTHVDELPQLWNVLKGQMSIIGPRAEWIKLVERYEKQLPFYHLRQMVKPGITGWAQVNYGYGASYEDTLEKLQYDLYYVKHYSPLMDASIILKTIYTMLSGSGR